MNKKVKIIIITLLIVLLSIICLITFSNEKEQLITVKSDKELLKIYEGRESDIKDLFTYFITMPFSFFDYNVKYAYGDIITNDAIMGEVTLDSASSATEGLLKNEFTSSSSSKDYSTTNIQVENVDEADITKTDGDYIYSISEDNVIITNVTNPEKIEIASTINEIDGSIPEDLILYKNELVVISAKGENNLSYYGYSSNNITVVKVYNISDRTNPILVKKYELNQPYYTTRCINNVLYVISSGRMKKEENKINRIYNEDNTEKEIELDNFKYLRDVHTKQQTIISVVDLDNVLADIKVSSYLIDISNAYVSQNSMYLLDQKYNYDYDAIPISKIFGIKGIFGLIEDDNDELNSGYNTEIYKFDISKHGDVEYKTKTKVTGKTINQYSLDEKDKHLRIAVYDDNGSRVVILDENLHEIGSSKYVAEGEKMYSSRFVGDKVYFVTFKTMDPLFVIDLSDEKNPEVLGELKIPGYSTYLHPYDENYLIGIGMQTEEVVRKNSSGKVISTTYKITGMKMALFDVSNVNKPKQISETIIGDSRTTSAILTNPKALLFSKERNLIAIPVNNYSEDFEINNTSDNYSSIVSSYTSYNKARAAEGYFVYNINIEDGFDLKGVITHNVKNKINDRYYNYNSKLLRGLYIEDNLYTISETAIKVNKLDTLELLNELKISY